MLVFSSTLVVIALKTVAFCVNRTQLLCFYNTPSDLLEDALCPQIHNSPVKLNVLQNGISVFKFSNPS